MTEIYLKEERKSLKTVKNCYHCGETCGEDIMYDGKDFCCIGCLSVYKILYENNLCEYYNIEENPGVSFKNSGENYDEYSWLDDDSVKEKILTYSDDKIQIAVFFIPSIHCSSCIWLLENLQKLQNGIISSEVNFLSKTAEIRFSTDLRLSEVVSLISRLGYRPEITLESTEVPYVKKKDRSIYYRIGVAGFCFSNIMILSFPEYLSLSTELDRDYRNLFGLLNIVLAIPVFFYSAYPYFSSALSGLRARSLNIDFPISLGLFVLFFRSVYEISTGTGAGFMDSLSGLVFFLLIGRIFQQKTYDSLNFERTYKSFFPLSVAVIENDDEIRIPVNKLRTGDRIVIRHNEIVPADSILFGGDARIDYSFVTGESLPVSKSAGEIIYAGGRQTGGKIELEVIRPVNQSYLTSLWNKESFRKSGEERFNSFVNVVGKYFTFVILIISSAAFLYWYIYYNDIRTAINAFTAVLIIACPCGIALTSPFALGNVLRILGRKGFYIKSAGVIERMSVADTIVFDKTGTITKNGDSEISFSGDSLSDYEKKLIKSLAINSSHPLSRIIANFLGDKRDVFDTFDFREYSGMGSRGIVEGHEIKIGSLSYVTGSADPPLIDKSYTKTSVFISINGSFRGVFRINNLYRDNISEVMNNLNESYNIFLLSGDNESEKNNLSMYFRDENICFNQSPRDKVEKIESLKNSGKKVMMFGDGLNDAAAMRVADVSVAVSDGDLKFTPSSDGIMEAGVFPELHRIIKYSKSVKRIIFAGFTISALYNIIGITIAFNYVVTPLMAAILMPLASISAVMFAVAATSFKARRMNLI
ncbi:MAG: heavy metal translocating P-type ATPase metal-binding domain-containing protein [Ignavibacteria bacterium]|nr:heavy metal translocating P-type ATPase metal-binding domain-containing protein [Ignavibacteria bacterium]